jgi:integrase
MAILAECPACRNKQSRKNKVCKKCGADMDKAKRAQKVQYWIVYRLPDGKQRKEFIGNSVKDAVAADGERKSQKRRKQFFDMLPESRMTFKELSEWYLDLPKIKRLKSYDGTKIRLNNFNNVFGDKTVSTIQPVDLENYQMERKGQGIKNTTIDLELNIVKGMIIKGFDNNMVSGETLKAFRKTKKISVKSERIRKRTLTIDEYLRLLDEAAPHLKGMLIVAFNTGMRPGEVKGLNWSYIDRKAMFIRLPADVTKEKAPKDIPVNHHVKNVIDRVPRAINHDFVFTYKGNPVKQRGGPSDAFQAACRRAGIPYGQKVKNGITMQDFRRSFKTNMLKAGIDKIYRDKIVGHSPRDMDLHYMVPSDSDLRQAMDKFTAWLDSEIFRVSQSVAHKTVSIK